MPAPENSPTIDPETVTDESKARCATTRMRPACHHRPVQPSQLVPIVEYIRGNVREGLHWGAAVIIDAEENVVRSWGDPRVVILPRSSNKVAQATAMVRAGLPARDDRLALSAASHSGESFHLDGVRAHLASVGLSEGALHTPADWPLDGVERERWLAAGAQPTRIAMNCSGKHAAMLATCVINGWDVESYLDPAHPLQELISQTVSELAGEPIESATVDGCGAPVLALSLVGLARTFSRAVQAPADTPERLVADAMRAHPEWVGGTRREVTTVMQSVPGLLLKDGADGVYAGALGDGTAFALKISDSSERARTALLAGALSQMGVSDLGSMLGSMLDVEVLGGGTRIGELRDLLN